MEVVLSACVFAAVAMLAGAAPAPENLSQEAPVLQVHEKQPGLYREKRSHYGGGVQYYSPCGSAPIPALAPAPAYHHAPQYAPHAYAPHGYGYGLPQYREIGDEQELAFSDMNGAPFMEPHASMMRAAYAPAPQYGGGLAPLSQATSAPAFGVFPNANPGGCSVPLLLSCSPSIVPGHIVNAHPAYAGGSYRDPEGHEELEEQQHHHHQDQQVNEPEQASANTHQ